MNHDRRRPDREAKPDVCRPAYPLQRRHDLGGDASAFASRIGGLRMDGTHSGGTHSFHRSLYPCHYRISLSRCRVPGRGGKAAQLAPAAAPRVTAMMGTDREGVGQGPRAESQRAQARLEIHGMLCMVSPEFRLAPATRRRLFWVGYGGDGSQAPRSGWSRRFQPSALPVVERR
jgi:hypothetical protein